MRALSFVGAIVLCATPAGFAAHAVAGGKTIQIQQAPWTVYIQPSDPNGVYCDGVIVDSLHIVTAAHCVYTDKGARLPPSAFTIDAGVSVIQAPLATDAQQLIKGVASIRVHPGYTGPVGNDSLDDVAVLTLTAPLDLSGAAVQAVALPAANAAFPGGTDASIAGFGIQKPGVVANGLLNRLDAATDPQGVCGKVTAVIRVGDATLVCAGSPSASVCNGDSGSGLVTTGPTPTLIGIVAEVPASCAAGLPGIYTYVGAPEILQFIRGNDHPPTAPRAGSVTLKWRAPLKVGSTLTCASDSWTGNATLTYLFIDAKTDQVLQKGVRPTFRTRTRDVSHAVECTVIASNAGGSAVIPSTATPLIGR